MLAALVGKNLYLFGGGHVTEAEAQRETIHLRFRQRIGALELDGILGRDDEEQAVQRAPHAVEAHLAFAHGFQHRRLGAR